ncbi:NAD(P)H-quinone oxidoreductase subunit S, chloroplastic-like [Vicia villosa]|uniref:NAD(P)H-quinone oxidoreductase subunit S, chloroplastic-like n=1 Tax=Vicia villosa TaxID=3911 RepID=UPI00273C70CB|nr:NAD(P)H-quinone oxidoreductase subunit S, chloroplastic-like [Vicia villosa]
MVIFASLQGLHGSLLRSQFLGQDHHHLLVIKTSKRTHRNLTCQPQICAEFNILKMMGGRGLCNGEKGVEKELKRKIDKEETPSSSSSSSSSVLSSSNEKVQENSEKLASDTVEIPEDGFEKEMMGLTGGFPGGEKGLIKFIEENPPRKISQTFSVEERNQSLVEEPKTS